MAMRQTSAGYVLTNMQMSEIRDAFQIFDTQKQGRISIPEFQISFKSLGFVVTEAQMEAVVANFCSEEKQYILFDEFLAACIDRYKEVDNLGELQQAFNLLSADQGKSKKLTADDFERAAKELGQQFTEEDRQLVLRVGDREGKGYISENDFFRFMTQGE